MPTHGKRYLEAAKTVSGDQGLKEPEEAIGLVKKLANTKFDETIDAAIRLGVDPKHGDQMVRGVTTLPHGTGKSRKVAVFAKGEKADEATAAGADVVGAEDLMQRIQQGWRDFDMVLATPDMMPVVGKLGPILRQQMPSQKAGTVSQDIGRVIKEIKTASRVEFRVDKAGIIHVPVGKASFSQEQLMQNFFALVSALLKARPSAAKGRYLRKISLSSTMGPSVEVDSQKAQSIAEKS